MFNFEKKEVLASLEGLVLEAIELHKKSWKPWFPCDLLFPRDSSLRENDRIQQIRELSAEAANLPSSIRACFALNSLTEAGLPHFTRLIARYLGDRDFWKEWNGRWTAEEDRHDAVMRGYALLTNFVNLRALSELELQYLESGFRPIWDEEDGHDDPYQLLAYTAVQEEATYRSHRNVSRLVKNKAPNLCQILAKVAGEEMAHANFYQQVFGWVLEKDLDRGLVSFFTALRQFSMPGNAIPAFDNLSQVARRFGVFTARDLKEITERLITLFNIEELSPVSSKGRKAQERILRLPGILARAHDKFSREPEREFKFSFLTEPVQA